MTFGQFFQDNILLFLLLAAVLGAIMMLEFQSRSTSGKKVSNSQAAILTNNGGILIDLRAPSDFKTARIARAINIPAAEFASSLGKIKGGKDSAIVLYDDNGYNTTASAKVLISEGFTDIFILENGFNGWVGENLPVVSK